VTSSKRTQNSTPDNATMKQVTRWPNGNEGRRSPFVQKAPKIAVSAVTDLNQV
jgi:hypothetical protein